MKLRLCIVAASIGAVVQPVVADDFKFAPRVTTAGIIHEYVGGWEHFVGGGMATFDCNADDFPDVFLAGGENPSSLLVNTTRNPGAPITFKTIEDGDPEPSLRWRYSSIVICLRMYAA